MHDLDDPLLAQGNGGADDVPDAVPVKTAPCRFRSRSGAGWVCACPSPGARGLRPAACPGRCRPESPGCTGRRGRRAGQGSRSEWGRVPADPCGAGACCIGRRIPKGAALVPGPAALESCPPDLEPSRGGGPDCRREFRTVPARADAPGRRTRARRVSQRRQDSWMAGGRSRSPKVNVSPASVGSKQWAAGRESAPAAESWRACRSAWVGILIGSSSSRTTGGVRDARAGPQRGPQLVVLYVHLVLSLGSDRMGTV